MKALRRTSPNLEVVYLHIGFFIVVNIWQYDDHTTCRGTESAIYLHFPSAIILKQNSSVHVEAYNFIYFFFRINTTIK